MISGNRITSSHRSKPLPFGAAYGLDQRQAVVLKQCTRVSLRDNIVEAPGPFLDRPLSVGAGVKDVAGADDGVTVVGSE